MITGRDKEYLAKLIKSCADNATTDELLTLIAETNGMLDACAVLLQDIDAGLRDAIAWVSSQCRARNLDDRDFLYEIKQILTLFKPGNVNDRLYAFLGLEPGASRDEIKQQYRTLCRKYHPDAVKGGSKEFTEAFITITQAYHTLLHFQENEEQLNQVSPSRHWRRTSGKKTSSELKRKNAIMLSLLAVLLVAVSLLAARAYNSRVMLTGLKNKGTAFVPPRREADDHAEKMQQALPTPNEATSMASLPERQVVKTEATDSEPQQRDSSTFSPSGQDADSPIEKIAHSSKVSLAKTSNPADHSTTPHPSPETEPRRVEPSRVKSAVLSSGASAPASRASVTTTASERSKINSPLSAATVETAPDHYHIEERAKTGSPVEHHQHMDQSVAKSSTSLISSVQQENSNQHHTGNIVASTTVLPLDPLPAASPTNTQITQERIDLFLKEYCRAYHQRNISSFSAFFEGNALENGKSLHEVLTTYSTLFQTTETLQLDVRPLKWKQEGEAVNLQGRFSIALTYLDGKAVNGNGSIDFLLVQNNGTLRILSMNYNFDQ